MKLFVSPANVIVKRVEESGLAFLFQGDLNILEHCLFENQNLAPHL